MSRRRSLSSAAGIGTVSNAPRIVSISSKSNPSLNRSTSAPAAPQGAKRPKKAKKAKRQNRGRQVSAVARNRSLGGQERASAIQALLGGLTKRKKRTAGA